MFSRFGRPKEQTEKEKGANTARNPSLERLRQAGQKLKEGSSKGWQTTKRSASKAGSKIRTSSQEAGKRLR